MSRYSTRPGDSVWVVREADEHTVHAYGLGTYLGDQPRPGLRGPFGISFKEMADLLREQVLAEDRKPIADFEISLIEAKAAAGHCTAQEAGHEILEAIADAMAERARPLERRIWDRWRLICKNPKMLLADGTIVWGDQSWWGRGGLDRAHEFVRGRRVVVVSGDERDRALPARP